MAGHGRGGGAIRRVQKKGSTAGSGGQRRKSLQGRGATPKAEDRVYHKAHKRAAENQRRAQGRHYRKDDQPSNELVVGRNPVLECLRARVPAMALFVAEGTANDDRLSEIVHTAAERDIHIAELPRTELDRLTGNGLHQGVGLQVPPYEYADPFDIFDRAVAKGEAPLIVVADGITDPRNLGAIVRSVAAFGGHGVVIPERRAASMTAVAWRTSAGAAARLPVARATNIARTLVEYAKRGPVQIVGLAGDGDASLDDYDGSTGVIIVVGSEGKGLSRLVAEKCDTILSIPISSKVESLNASVAAGVVLSEFARQRRIAGKK